MSSNESVGFIGLGVMGEPMCRNLAEKGGVEVIGYDIRHEPLGRLSAFGVAAAPSIADVGGRCDVIFLSLPAAEHVRDVCAGGLRAAGSLFGRRSCRRPQHRSTLYGA